VTVAELSVESRRDSDTAVLALTGEIDMSTAGRLRTAVGDALSGAPGRIVLDFGGVTFCDSQGLSTLIGLSRQAGAADCALVLTNLGDFLLRLLDITGLRPAFQIES
jgi:anti-anti-sigma factor